MYDARSYIWDEPYILKQELDKMMRRCVPESEMRQVMNSFHSSVYGGHHVDERTTHKVLQIVFSGLLCLKMLQVM